MKIFGLSIAIAFCVVVSGCAMAPESVRPAYVSELSYMNYTCDQLGQEQLRLAAALSTASDAQRQARSNDIAGVIFLGVPVSTLSGGNVASEIARLKGELEAVQKTAIQKDCNFALTPDPTAKEPRTR
jgi:hypothetical protein